MFGAPHHSPSSCSNDCSRCKITASDFALVLGSLRVFSSTAIYSMRWLLVPVLIQYHSLCQMYCQFHSQHSQCISLNPPIQFGHGHSHHTRLSMTVFACPERYRLAKCPEILSWKARHFLVESVTAMRASARQPFSRTFIVLFIIIALI